ncbi:Eco57I restriction-modification methylase domain-containing protein [Mammaliicoccus sciuri]|uniref:Eco57I restriction-modification methylase domain-containing protein n=1 Tax=Mammaliicoccus sciuri TaxID=1296 RepID=UPI001E54D0CE|nr:N-6 DNA methylase [Mammaliicoccus sciuri]MCD8898579.1 N-6 DNA methylase [Mammaliicoccus sciuri]
MKLKTNATSQKLRGAYYTPNLLANFMMNWGMNKSVSSILEPSCGNGIFLNALSENKQNFKCTAVEIFEEEYLKAHQQVKNDSRFKVVNDDFYHYFENDIKNEKYDLVIGNPPYIRYQYLSSEQRTEQSLILTKNGMKANKLINAWVSFTVASVQLMNKDGKIAFVIPAELLQVKYAEDLRKYLMTHLQKITIITFKKLIFPEVEQEVVVLLGEKISSQVSSHQIRIIECNDIEDLNNSKSLIESIPFKDVDFNTTKWIRYFLSPHQNNLIESIQNDGRFFSFSDIGQVDIGITTGNNSYFCIDNETVEKYNLAEVTRPLIARSVNIPGVTFNYNDWEANIKKGSNTFLIDFNKKNYSDLTPQQKKYIDLGEKNNENTGYKCRIRKEWYKIPSIYSPDAFFLRRNHNYPKFVLNNVEAAVSTDTMHRIRFSIFTDKRKALLSYYNSISLAFTELEARSYGGGVLEILPGELEKVTIPNLENVAFTEEELNNLITKIDYIIRHNGDINEVLDLVDNAVLINKLNISQETVTEFKRIWNLLKNRRLNRNL